MADGSIYYIVLMEITWYPDKQQVDAAMRHDDPLLMLISFDGDRMIISNIDDSLEHHILLKQAGFNEGEIDNYFRIVVNRSGASWTYVCPRTYLNIPNRDMRLKKYFENGIDEISRALRRIGYDVPIDIPERYRRHFDALSE